VSLLSPSRRNVPYTPIEASDVFYSATSWSWLSVLIYLLSVLWDLFYVFIGFFLPCLAPLGFSHHCSHTVALLTSLRHISPSG